MKIVILTGGQSDEHVVSLASAKSILDVLKCKLFELQTTVITKKGYWLGPDESYRAVQDGHEYDGGVPPLEGITFLKGCDVVFPVIHGQYGEDGRLQGLLDTLSIPCVGAGVLCGALCMDKAIAKCILKNEGITQTKYVIIYYEDLKNPDLCCSKVTSYLRPPWFVKPANSGSSIGVTKVTKINYLHNAITEACKYDKNIIVEEGVRNVRELEIGVLQGVKTSIVGEVTYDSDFYDYATKYTLGCSKMHIPAKIPNKVQQKVVKMALHACKLLRCTSIARVDFFYCQKKNKLFLNEVNTFPGFTKLSMFPLLWEHSGITYYELLCSLIDDAIKGFG